MNFFAHACIASTRSNRPHFVLGAMLPDLAGMMGARIEHAPDPEVRAGVAHHHEADAAFHFAPAFSALCGDAVTRLTANGVERGSARAVGHVGVELLLDGALSDDDAARARYSDALAAALATPTIELVTLRDPSQARALRDGIARLMRAPVPEGYRDPEFVVGRLHHILGQRPRLSLREADLPHVRAWARDAQAKVIEQRALLLDQVLKALGAAQSLVSGELLG